MTYCLGIMTRSGLVIAADSRTNAGVDNISTYRKLFDFTLPGERLLVLCTAGNLSITQAVVNGLRRDLSHSESVNLHALPSLYDIARYIGEKVRQIQSQDREWLKKDGIDSQCSLLLGGQIQGQNLELYLIYTQGNFIQATQETPFLQVGEIKYGKPILDRILSYETSLEDAAKCALLSIDSTMKSNVSVGPPIDLVVAETNGLTISRHLRLGSGDPYLSKIRKLWELSLKKAFEQMPTVEWEQAAAAQPSDGNLSDPKTRPCNA